MLLLILSGMWQSIVQAPTPPPLISIYWFRAIYLLLGSPIRVQLQPCFLFCSTWLKIISKKRRSEFGTLLSPLVKSRLFIFPFPSSSVLRFQFQFQFSSSLIRCIWLPFFMSLFDSVFSLYWKENRIEKEFRWFIIRENSLVR